MKGQAAKEKTKEAQEQMAQASNEKEQKKSEVKFIDVPVEVLGKYKGKNYVNLKGLSYNTELGHLSFHLDEKHTMLFKDHFQKQYLNIVVKEADKVEQAVKTAPQFDRGQSEQSKARMRVLGERDGRVFVGPSGSVKYDGTVKGLVVNLDDKHTMVVDSQTLSKELGIKISPLAMEKNVGLGR
ncbi:MAG: hypothetical protein AB7G93_13345 [Bdellovibrionales bacterium]